MGLNMLLVQKENQRSWIIIGGWCGSDIMHVVHVFGTCFKWVTNAKYGVDNLSQNWKYI